MLSLCMLLFLGFQQKIWDLHWHTQHCTGHYSVYNPPDANNIKWTLTCLILLGLCFFHKFNDQNLTHSYFWNTLINLRRGIMLFQTSVWQCECCSSQFLSDCQRTLMSLQLYVGSSVFLSLMHHIFIPTSILRGQNL